jgi:alkanesulfonate monooxygenase SsuD/methylene tetrahydromethanopterin reductase-like flavin-dependent oxidoreductase (luciferase family)
MLEGQEAPDWKSVSALVDATERLGFEAFFMSDHYGSMVDPEHRPGAFDSWGVLAALAARTPRIRFGTMVSPVTFRPPAVLAKLAITVDHVSDGRVEVGIGAGWNEREHEEFGFELPPIGVRLGMLEEQATIVRALLDGETVHHSGEHYRLAGAHLPPARQARVPIILGGAAKPRAARLAARVADEYNLVFETPGSARSARERLDGACEAAGRDPATLPLSVMTRFVIGADQREYRKRIRRLSEIVGEDVESGLETEGGAWIVGTADAMLERIDAFRRAGVQRFMLQHIDYTDLDSLEFFAAEVLPAASA